MAKTQIVILGKNYTSLLGMIRSVSNENFDITVIRINHNIPPKGIKTLTKKIFLGKTIEEASKYVKEYIVTKFDRKLIVDLLINKFSNVNNKVILIPTDDFTTSTIDLYQDELKEKFLFPNIMNKKGEIVNVMDKSKQKQIAIEKNLNVAKGYIINVTENNYNIPKDISYPVFVKPEITFMGKKAFMKKCNDEKELNELLDKFSKEYHCPVLVEQYIEIEKEYTVNGCCYNDEVIMPAFITAIEEGDGGQRGVILLGEVLPFDESSDLYKKIKDFVLSLNFNGLFNIDLFESNGVIYFSEINLRIGVSGYIITRLGINLPKIYINNLLGIQNNQPLKMLYDKKFINERVNLEKYNDGYITWKQYKNFYKDADLCFTKLNDDMKPYYSFKKQEFYTHIKKILKL